MTYFCPKCREYSKQDKEIKCPICGVWLLLVGK